MYDVPDSFEGCVGWVSVSVLISFGIVGAVASSKEVPDVPDSVEG